MSRPIITKVKSLKRNGKRLEWSGHNRTKKSATLEALVTFWPDERVTFTTYRHRNDRHANWTMWVDAVGDNRAHLLSLLTPQDLAACTAAAIAYRSAQGYGGPSNMRPWRTP